MTKYIVKPSKKFQKDLKKVKSRGYNINLLAEVIQLLADGKTLPQRYQDHKLSGNFKGCRECHVLPDWLLIYEIVENELLLYLTRTGTHSDLF